MSFVHTLLVALASLPLLASGSCGPAATPSTPPPGPGSSSLLVIEDDAPTNESACEERLSFARETIADVVERASGECTQDRDCALIFMDTECQGACQAAILRSRLDAYDRAKQAIDARACTDYMADGCAYSTPRCLEVQAICEASRCTTAPRTEAAG